MTTDRLDTDRAGKSWPGWLVLFVGAFLLYALTANRGPQWQDSGQHILRIMDGRLIHPLGLALSHPLHYWLGRAAIAITPFEPCLAITLLSSLAGAIAVANVFGCVRTLTGDASAALLAALMLAVAHTFWQMSTLTETYTLAAALLSGECWMVALYAVSGRRHYLWGACLLNGLGLANHLLALLTTPIIGCILVVSFWRKPIRVGGLLLGGLAWLIGSLPYTALVGMELARSPSAGAVIRSALFGHSYHNEVLNTSLSARLLLVALAFIVLSFPTLQLPAAVYGIVKGWTSQAPKLARRAFLAGLIIHALFALRYSVIDQHLFFLPLYVLASLLAGVGYAAFWKRWGSAVRRKTVMLGGGALVLTVVLYALVPGVARRFDLLEGVERNKPYRDDYAYLFTPWSVAEHSAEQMSDHALKLAGVRGLIIVEDATAEFAVAYRVRRSGLADVHVTRDLLPDQIRAMMREGGAVVLAPNDADRPRIDPPTGAWRRDGDLYVLTTADSP